MKWQGTITNEFHDCWIGWHDYVSVMIHNFPIILWRRYDWPDKEQSTYTLDILGVELFCKIKDWK
jgi:hypothetical protein